MQRTKFYRIKNIGFRTKKRTFAVLLFCFNLKKFAAESHRLLVEVYGEHTLSETICRD